MNSLEDKTKKKVREFEEIDAEFREFWTRFEENHQEELENLELMRERRNSKLDAAIRSLRNNVEGLDYREVKAVEEGKFKVSKKWSSFYIPEMFVAISKRLGVFDDLVQNGVIKYNVTIDYNRAKEWIRANGLELEFASSEDGKEKSPAIYGPKPVPSWGAESK